jgi:hypothetical protein
MADDKRDDASPGEDSTQNGDASSEENRHDDDASSEDRPAGADLDAKVGDMEHGIERVGDDIDQAKEDADKAESLDPQPLAGSEDAPPIGNEDDESPTR